MKDCTVALNIRAYVDVNFGIILGLRTESTKHGEEWAHHIGLDYPSLWNEKIIPNQVRQHGSEEVKNCSHVV